MANFQIIPVVIEINRPTKLTGIVCSKSRISEEFGVISISRNIGGGCTFTFLKSPVGNHILISGHLICPINLGTLLLGDSGRIIGVQPEYHPGNGVFGKGSGLTITYSTRTNIHEIALQFDIEHGAISREITDRTTHNWN